MQVSLTLIKYRTRFIPFALIAMALHRFPMWTNKKISFYKLLGTGRNGSFDKRPDWNQWGILAVHDTMEDLSKESIIKKLYGNFIASWFRIFRCELYTYLLEPIEGHGTWDHKEPFGHLPSKSTYSGAIAVLTRATIKLNKLKYFWENVAPVTAKMHLAKGFVTSYGIGELPLIKQATFSIWQSKEEMLSFAYGMKEHTEVIKKTRLQKWYIEEMFVRFKIKGTFGIREGITSLEGKV